MAEKRFVRKGYKIWDTWEDEEVYELHYRYEVEDICRILNDWSKKNEQLKQENQSWLKTASHFDNIAHKDRDYAERIHKENKELKEEIAKFKEWEKHIGDVKREDLDRVFKMSIYEITEAFEYYEKRIKELSE